MYKPFRLKAAIAWTLTLSLSRPLVDLIKGRNITVQVKAASALESLAENNPASQKAFLKLNTPEALIRLLKVRNKKKQYWKLQQVITTHSFSSAVFNMLMAWFYASDWAFDKCEGVIQALKCSPCDFYLVKWFGKILFFEITSSNPGLTLQFCLQCVSRFVS